MSEQVMDLDAVRAGVREHYGSRVANASSSCCSPAVEADSPGSCCSPNAEGDSCGSSGGVALYSAEELATIPDEAANVSFGCGNPTALASLRLGEAVLDLGSGGGIDVFLAARQVGETGYVYGVDMTDEMLDLARRNQAKHGITNVEFRKGHIEDIPLVDKSVDVIISNCVVNLSPDKGQTLKEAFRVLRPGGRLSISDIVVDGTLDDLPVSEEQIRTALSWAGCIAGALTIEQYETLLTAAGFEEIDVAIQHRYNLEELGQDMEDVARQFSPAVADKLVRRFTSSLVTAKRAA